MWYDSDYAQINDNAAKLVSVVVATAHRWAVATTLEPIHKALQLDRIVDEAAARAIDATRQDDYL